MAPLDHPLSDIVYFAPGMEPFIKRGSSLFPLKKKYGGRDEPLALPQAKTVVIAPLSEVIELSL